MNFKKKICVKSDKFVNFKINVLKNAHLDRDSMATKKGSFLYEYFRNGVVHLETIKV